MANDLGYVAKTLATDTYFPSVREALVVSHRNGTARICDLNAKPLRLLQDYKAFWGESMRSLDATESLVRFDLEEKEGVTTVRLTHSGLVSERSRASHKGWPQILMWLQAYVQH